MDVTRLYDFKNDTAIVVMEGYYPDTVSDARDVQKKLVAIANGTLDAIDANVASFSMIVGNEIHTGTASESKTMLELDAVEDAENGESSGDPMAPAPVEETKESMTPKQETNQQAAELISKIDSEMFFGASLDVAQSIQKRYAPIAQQPVAILKEILAQLQASQVKK